jgi:hypothetical protein
MSRPLAIGAAWLAFVIGLLIGGEIGDLGSIAIGAAVGALLVVLGFSAAWPRRPLPQRNPATRVRLGVSAIAVGVAFGVANLAANWLIAQRDPAIRAVLAERMATMRPLNAIVAAPLVEEVAVRLFLMSVLAWLAFRFTKQDGLSFAIALCGSSLVFALLHLERPFPGDPALASYYRTTLIVKYTVASLPLGWVFWRWGLPYSILYHAAANAVHLALQKNVF